MDKLRVLSLFSGIGAFEKALTNIGVPYKLVNFCEIDKYAIKSYCAIHGVDESLNLGDITKINLDSIPQNIDLVTHGSPCQDHSIAGKQLGDMGQRSVLMWNSVEIIKRIKPKYVIWENVKNVTSAKHKHNFDKYLEELSKFGYTSYYKILNSKDYGAPQNKERIFCVSILGEHETYEFPLPTRELVKLKDILEEKVDEKYYINKPFTLVDKKDVNSVCGRIANVDLNGHDYIKRVYDTEKCCPTLPTGTGGNHEPKILQVGKLNSSQDGLVVDSNGLSPTHTAGHGNCPKILENKIMHIANTNDRYESNARVYSEQGLSPTLASRDYKDAKKIMVEMKQDYRVRKLTPKECWRLQAFEDDDIQKCIDVGISNSQLYKQAGNSITVKVLEYIFKELFKEYIKQ